MTRQIWFIVWVLCGLVLLTSAVLVPAHFRAVDVKVIERAGTGTLSVAQLGARMLNQDKLGPARLLTGAAEMLNLEGSQTLQAVLTERTDAAAGSTIPVGTDPVFTAFLELFRTANSRPIIELLLERGMREKLIDFLQSSRKTGVQEILKTRMLTNTVQFPPVASASGQPLDASIALAAVLEQTDSLAPGLREKIMFLAGHANQGGSPENLETIYLNLLILGKRLEWHQLIELLRNIQDTTTLNDVADLIRNHEENLPIVYGAVLMSERPGRVAEYVEKHSTTAVVHLRTALSHGKGAVEELLLRDKKIYSSKWRLAVIGYDPFGAYFYSVLPLCARTPVVGLVLRTLLFLAGAWCIARSIGTLALAPQPAASGAGNHIRLAQELVMTLCLFAVIGVAAEPFIVSARSEPANPKLPFRLNLSLPESAAVTNIQQSIKPIMSLVTLASLLIFLVIQALIYIWCLSKLSEIRRQAMEPRLKLRLLENEEHLFDAGLYVGFVGTIISLILVSLGIIKPSIMAAYSSTSFGIIFVSILKIFHLRPFRRELILQTEPQP